MIDMTNYVINMELFLQDTENTFRVVRVTPYNGKAEDNIPAGSTFNLQILKDNSAPRVNRKTGLPVDDNVGENFEVNIPGHAYPSAIKKGDIVALEDFLPDISYYFDRTLLLRFGGIKLLKAKQATASAGGTSAKR